MTTTKQFSKKEAITFGWETTKKNFWFIVGVFFLSQIIPRVPQMMFGNAVENNSGLSFIVIALDLILQFIIAVGILKFALSYVDNKEPILKNLVRDPKQVWNFFLVSMLTALIVIGGLILLIVPGIIFAIKLKFAGYFLIDKNISPREALKASWHVTSDIKWQLFLLDLLNLGIVLLGVLALGIGVFVSIPVVSLAKAYVYRKLSSSHA